MAYTDYRGPFTGWTGSYNKGNCWHKSPTMFAGGHLRTWRTGKTLYYEARLMGDRATNTSYDYNVYIDILYRDQVIRTIDAGVGGNFDIYLNSDNQYRVSGNFENTEAGYFKIRYRCGQTGGCTKGYPTIYMLRNDNSSENLLYEDKYTIDLKAVKNPRVNGVQNTVVPFSDSELKLTWDAPTSGADRYDVYWSKGDYWRGPISQTTSKSVIYKMSNLISNTPRNQAINFNIVAIKGNQSKDASTLPSARLLPIPVIKDYPKEWSVEDTSIITIENPYNCSMNLGIEHNGTELVRKNNISIVDEKYILELTDTEKNTLYKYAATDQNPKFQFVFYIYYNGSYITTLRYDTKITFPTKAWVKVNGVWKRAIVWTKVNNIWKQSIPWVKVNNTWKRI